MNPELKLAYQIVEVNKKMINETYDHYLDHLHQAHKLTLQLVNLILKEEEERQEQEQFQVLFF